MVLITEFGRRVKTVLIARGWSQADLACFMGITPQALSQMLRTITGNKLETVEAVARVLNVDPRKLDPSYPRRAATQAVRQKRELERARRRRDVLEAHDRREAGL